MLSSGYAQQSTLRTTKIRPIKGDTLFIDSSAIIQNSFRVKGYNSGDYELYKNQLIWKTSNPSKPVTLNYRIVDIERFYAKKDASLIKNKFAENPFRYVPPQNAIPSSYGQLQTMGNISRGIGFGNAQDVVVNSNLNLRLRGKLANDVDVLAVISDQNNPIQPEGNTQQIQDFDQVYITLKKDSSVITLGDFLMESNQESYFMKYYKKSRGLQLKNKTSVKDWQVNTSAEAAISRGRFSRNRIEGIEGNSGPYRLSGTNGEIFIIVIAGTENVYLDGKLLTRGENHDYVVNYNTGEITFTPRILITQYSRIVVEFQYSDRNYARSVSRVGTSVSKGEFTVYSNFFNEMDLKTQPFQQSLDGFDSLTNRSAIDILKGAGDELAFYSNAQAQAEYNTDRIMYKKVEVGPIEYFEYAEDPSESTQFYAVSFTNVGFGNGTYSQAQTGANGKVFKYVGPGLGDYLPLEILIAPQRLNTFNLGVVRATEDKETGFEYSLSSLDKNTFSIQGDADNRGYGFKVFRRQDKTLKDSGARLTSDFNYELVSSRYNYVERFRSVEFDRQWNKVLTNPTSLSELIPAFEHVGNAKIRYEKNTQNFASNYTSVFFRPGTFSGVSNLTKAGFSVFGMQSNSSLELMNSNSSMDSSELGNLFYSFNTSLIRPFKKFRTGVYYSNEQSAFTIGDSLTNSSYGYSQLKTFIGSAGKSKLQYNLSVSQRNDQLSKNEGFSGSTIGRDVNLQAAFKPGKLNSITTNTTYRQLQILDTLLSNKPIENTLQSRIEMDLSFLKRFIRSRTFYQIGTGQEQRREFQYLQVQPGNGVFIWNDYDTNGIKTLNEFEIASDLDRQRADYIKIYTPVAGFITTNTNKISQTLELNPRVFVKSTDGKKPFYSKFSNITSVIYEKKVLPNTLADFVNPFDNNLSDTNLINNSKNLRSTLFYNRTNSVYSIDYTYINNSNKVLLTNGFDSRENKEHILNNRINLSRVFSLTNRFRIGDKRYTSQFFGDRSYFYSFWSIEPKLQYIYKNKFRADLKTSFYQANNAVEFGGESSKNIEVGTEMKYTKPQKGTLLIAASYINVDYQGETGTTLGYELLRGLQNGNNATWRLSYQQTLANNIQVVLSYDGRKSEDAPVIHIGRLVARYLF